MLKQIIEGMTFKTRNGADLNQKLRQTLIDIDVRLKAIEGEGKTLRKNRKAICRFLGDDQTSGDQESRVLQGFGKVVS